MRNSLKLLMLGLMVLTVSCSSSKKVVEADNISSKRTTDIKVTKVEMKEFTEEYTLPGTVEAWEVVPVAIETPGPVKTIYVKEGDYVKAGDIILTLNTDSLAANLESSRAQLELRKQDFERTDALYKSDATSKKNYDDARNALRVAESSFRVAKEQQSKSILRAPVTGIVDTVAPKEGEYLNSGYIVSKIVVMDKLKVYLEVPEKDIQFLKLNDIVNVYPADIGEVKEIVKGSLNYISVTADPKSLTYKTRIDLAGNTSIRPGRIVRAEIVKRKVKDVIVVELYSVISKGDNRVVYVIENGLAKERKVVLGAMSKDAAVVLDGLNVGELLVTTGQQFLADNSTVKIVE